MALWRDDCVGPKTQKLDLKRRYKKKKQKQKRVGLVIQGPVDFSLCGVCQIKSFLKKTKERLTVFTKT